MYRRLAQEDLIKKLEDRGAVFMGWYNNKTSDKVQAYFDRYGLGLGYFTGGPQPWGDMEDNNTRVASAATVIDLRSGKIIYSSARKAANTAQIIEAIDAAK